MATAQIRLSDQQRKALRTIAQQTGKTEDEIIREAVEQFIAGTQFPSQFQGTDRRALLQQACGMWRDRTDLPALATLRSELDRLFPIDEQQHE